MEVGEGVGFAWLHNQSDAALSVAPHRRQAPDAREGRTGGEEPHLHPSDRGRLHIDNMLAFQKSAFGI